MKMEKHLKELAHDAGLAARPDGLTGDVVHRSELLEDCQRDLEAGR